MKKGMKKIAIIGMLASLTMTAAALPMTAAAYTSSPEQVLPKQTVSVKINNSLVYNGKSQSPSVTVKDSSGNVISSKYYTITKNKYAGRYRIQIIFKGKYKNVSYKSVTYKINKGSTTITKGTTSKTYKANSRGVTSSTKIFSINAKAVRKTYTRNVSYTKLSGSSKIAVTKTGRVIIAKGTKKGTYKVRVKLYRAATANYKAGTRTVTLTIKVK